MGDTDSLSTYSHYWKLFLVPHILSGNFDCSFKLAQEWTFQQVEFQHSDLGESTDGLHSFILLTSPYIILHPGPYSDGPKQPRNPMLYSVNPVN